ncbi:flagellar protein FliT [Paraburkholderia sp.]|uniref:flagellar protein FliT n=1 Tax=Paraburkholderia sp. TaxID=1926495 RepID=UPI003D6F8C85
MSHETLSRAYELTQAMSAAAAASDWLRAAELADERSPLLMSLGAGQTPDALATIRAIQALNADITRIAQQGRDVLTNDMNASMRRVEAVSFYHTTGQL